MGSWRIVDLGSMRNVILNSLDNPWSRTGRALSASPSIRSSWEEFDEKQGAVPRSQFVEELLRQALERPEFIKQARNPITRPISFSAEMLMELLRMQQEKSNPYNPIPLFDNVNNSINSDMFASA